MMSEAQADMVLVEAVTSLWGLMLALRIWSWGEKPWGAYSPP